MIKDTKYKKILQEVKKDLSEGSSGRLRLAKIENELREFAFKDSNRDYDEENFELELLNDSLISDLRINIQTLEDEIRRLTKVMATFDYNLDELELADHIASLQEKAEEMTLLKERHKKLNSLLKMALEYKDTLRSRFIKMKNQEEDAILNALSEDAIISRSGKSLSQIKEFGISLKESKDFEEAILDMKVPNEEVLKIKRLQDQVVRGGLAAKELLRYYPMMQPEPKRSLLDKIINFFKNLF